MVPSLLLLLLISITRAHTEFFPGVRPCRCNDIFTPVCADDGQMYPNPCEATCNGKVPLCDGSCPCASAGTSQQQQLPPAQQQQQQPSPPQQQPPQPPQPQQQPQPHPDDDCLCMDIDQPVCGRDGNTYGNSCMSRCRGAGIACKGRCPCSSAPSPAASPFAPSSNINPPSAAVNSNPSATGFQTMNPSGGGAPTVAPMKPSAVTPVPPPPAVIPRPPSMANLMTNAATTPASPASTSSDGETRKSNFFNLAQDVIRHRDHSNGETCVCPLIHDPVCGSDGREYFSECSAGCHGAKKACSGGCPCDNACICNPILDWVCGGDGRDYTNDCQAGCRGVDVVCKGKCPCSPVPN